jgi:hypothetical protein
MRSFINANTLTSGIVGHQVRTDVMGMIQLRNLAAGFPCVYCGPVLAKRSCIDSLRSCQRSHWRDSLRCRTARTRHCGTKRRPSTCAARPSYRLGFEPKA